MQFTKKYGFFTLVAFLFLLSVILSWSEEKVSLDGNLPPDTDSRLFSSKSVLSFLTDRFLLTWTVQGKFHLAKKLCVQHLIALLYAFSLKIWIHIPLLSIVFHRVMFQFYGIYSTRKWGICGTNLTMSLFWFPRRCMKIFIHWLLCPMTLSYENGWIPTQPMRIECVCKYFIIPHEE